MLNPLRKSLRRSRALRIARLGIPLALFSIFAAGAFADEAKWERKEFTCKVPEKGCYITSCCTDIELMIQTRDKDGTAIKEVRAVGDIDATPEKVFNLVTDYEHQVGVMPYIKDQKVFTRTDGEVRFWAVADFPMVSMRDWVLHAKLERNFEGGKFRTTWEPIEAAEAAPAGDGVVRLKVNSGSWTLEPLDGGKRTRATYYLFTDPGGSIPGFIANKANTTALPDLFAAVRKGTAPK